MKLETGGGDGCCVYSYPPEFVLYANGRLIVHRDIEGIKDGRTQLMTKTFSRQELCSVLNTIDRTGFLQYDPFSYRPQSGDYFAVGGASTLEITVNIWSSSFGSYYALPFFLGFLSDPTSNSEILKTPGFPVILPALHEFYYFIENLASTDMEVYQPQRLGLIAVKTDLAFRVPDSPSMEWPFADISLSEVEAYTANGGYPSKLYIVEGSQAISIYKYFEDSFGNFGENVIQNSQGYVVFLRPILPYEVPQFQSYNILPDPAIQPPNFELECFPSDGVLPIPTSLYP